MPSLRFPDYKDDWIQCVLGDIAELFKGRNLAKDDIVEGGIQPAIRYGQLYTNYAETISSIESYTNITNEHLILSQANDVLIPSSGETRIDIATASCVMNDGVAIGSDINIVRTKTIDGRFLAYYLSHNLRIELAKLAQGSSVIHLYRSNLALLKLRLPSNSEQKQVADFLSTIDKKIDLLKKKKELLEKYKKAVMQQIFSQKIRFKKENGGDYPDWQKHQLSTLVQIVKGSQINNSELDDNFDYPMLNGGVEPSGYTEHWNREENTVAISEGGNSCGHVNLLKQKFWAGGHLYTLITKKRINQNFLYHYLKHQQPSIMRLRVGSGLPNIQKRDLESYQILTPVIEEQERIANFLIVVDEKIDIANTRIKQLRAWKKGLLQRMFI